MSLEDLLGTTVELPIARLAGPGAFLATGEDASEQSRDVVLLPGAELPEGAVVGTRLQVFIYRDSEDRFIATTIAPALQRGEVAFLRARQRNDVGVFFEWGLAKDLLVPFAEQTREPLIGNVYPIALYIDNSGRLAGTMRISELLHGAPDGLREGQWVEGEAWRNEPEIGLFVIVDKRHVGLLPRFEPHRLQRGDKARFRVAQVLEDGKFELSLRAPAHEQRSDDAEKIVEALRSRPDARFSDDSTPEAVQAAFGLSKKAFKRAVGSLFRAGRVQKDADGMFVLVKPSST